MAPRGGYTSPENMRTILDVVKYLKASGFVIPAGRMNTQFIPPDAPIYIRNDTGVEIPAFACVQCTGTVEAGGQNYIKVVKPADITATSGGYLFNGIAPIEISGYGIAYDGPLVRMLTNGSTIVCGDGWQPVVGAFTVATGGDLFSAVGADDIATNVMRAFIVPAGGSSWIEFVVVSQATATTGPYTGLVIASVTIKGGDNSGILDTTVSVVDHSGCIFDQDVTGFTGWAQWGVYKSLDIDAVCNTLTPYHYAAINRCCAAGSGLYDDPCPTNQTSLN